MIIGERPRVIAIQTQSNTKLSDLKFAVVVAHQRVLITHQKTFPCVLQTFAGTVITVTEIVDDNWYFGKIGSRDGMFPASYVIRDEAEPIQVRKFGEMFI